MTPEQLKASILQYAFQGKLVEQNDKEDIIDITKLKFKKTEDLEFEIPEKWKTSHLESITISIASKQYQIAESEYKESGKYPVVSQSKEYIIGYNDNIDKLYKHDKPIIIFGDHTTEVKYIDFDFIVGADGVKIFEPLRDIIDAMFLKYVLEYYSIGLEKVGGYTRHYKFIKNKPIPIPPLEEQHRIVSKIEELLPFVDRYAKSYEKLKKFNAKFPEDMKKSILQYAMQGKLVEQRAEEGTAEELYKKIQDEKAKLIKEGKIKKEKSLKDITDDELPFDIPESWKWVRWGDISQKIQYGYNAPAKQSGRIKMVRISDIQEGKVLWDTVPYCDINEDEIESYLLKKNDILFARTGGTVGKSYLVEDVPEESIYAGYLIRTVYSEKLCPKYLIYFMGTQLYWNQLINRTIATAQPNCNGKTLSKMILPLPPYDEQLRIVAKIEELFLFVDRYEDVLEKFK